MGQYGNQPDFGTRAQNIVPTGSPGNQSGENLKSAALYIGTGGTLICNVTGGNSEADATVFRNIPDGTFFPVIVNNVWNSATFGFEELSTTCSDIVALY